MFVEELTFDKILLWIFCCTLTLTPRPTIAIGSYSMADLCGREIPMIIDHVYQAQLVLGSDHWPDNSTRAEDGIQTCMLTISAWYTWPQIMFQINELTTPCHLGYLEISEVTNDWQSEVPVDGLPRTLCGTVTLDSTYTTRNRFLRVRFTSLTTQRFQIQFQMTFTVFNNVKCPEYGFQCKNGRCIEDSLKCNGHNSCGDNSDCFTNLVIVAAVSSGGIGVLIVGVVCVVLYRYRLKARHRQQLHEKNEECETNTTVDTCANTTEHDLTGKVV